jgi:hypothetical protein
MSATVTPISKVLVIAALGVAMSACGKNNDDALNKAEQSASQEAALDGKIECALAGAMTFARTCTTERISGQDGQLLVIRHADGGFRRFNILTDGRGLSPADGFDETKITILADGMIELKSGDDLYRLPAQIKAKPKNEATPAPVEPKAG